MNREGGAAQKRISRPRTAALMPRCEVKHYHAVGKNPSSHTMRDGLVGYVLEGKPIRLCTPP